MCLSSTEAEKTAPNHLVCLHAAGQAPATVFSREVRGILPRSMSCLPPACPCIHLKLLLLTVGCNSQNPKEAAFCRGPGAPKNAAKPVSTLFSKDAGILKERPRTVGTSSWAQIPRRGALRHRLQGNGVGAGGGAVLTFGLVKMCQPVAASWRQDPHREGQSSACSSSLCPDKPVSDGWLTPLC